MVIWKWRLTYPTQAARCTARKFRTKVILLDTSTHTTHRRTQHINYRIHHHHQQSPLHSSSTMVTRNIIHGYSITCLIVVFVSFCPNSFIIPTLTIRLDMLNCLDVWTSPYCMFDARHVDVRHTTGSSNMSYVVCRMSMSRICHRSKILVAGGVHHAVQCYSRLHTIGLQLCRHGIWALAWPYTKYTLILLRIIVLWTCNSPLEPASRLKGEVQQ